MLTSIKVLPCLIAGWILIIGSGVLAQQEPVTSVDQITQRGITFKFDKPYPHGQFANGDYWVVATGGELTITQMTPTFDGQHNGWVVNATNFGRHGYDIRVNGFDASLVPALPYKAKPGDAIVKTMSVDPADAGRPALRRASVLTVLAEVPPNQGRTLFRPPYVGKDRPLYSIEDLKPEKLPRVADAGVNTPTLDRIADRFEPVWLDNLANWPSRQIHPTEHMPAYGSGVAVASGEAVLRLMMDDPPEEKMSALINVVQWGIDLYHMRVEGLKWNANGGHQHGRKLVIAFAGVMLEHEGMKKAAALTEFPNTDERYNANIYHEDSSVYYSPVAKRVLWGQPSPHYWMRLQRNRGSKTARDPYGYIDGGERPGGGYQFCCNSMTWKATALSLHLMPELREAWNYEPFLDYVDRWVHFGAWAQPDPIALDLENPGREDGVGRFPNTHGTNANQGSWDSNFANAMWAKHRPNAAVAMPHIEPWGQVSRRPLTVTLSSPHTEGAVIYYTLDGSEPTDQSTRYTRPFTLNQSALVRVRAYKDGLYPSAINQAPFTIGANAELPAND